MTSELFFKEKEDEDYLNFLEYSFSEEFWEFETKEAEELMQLLMVAYEKMKELVSGESVHRLLVVTGNLDIDESSIEEIKNSYVLD